MPCLDYRGGLVKDCSISSALAIEILQSSNKPSTARCRNQAIILISFDPIQSHYAEFAQKSAVFNQEIIFNAVISVDDVLN